VLDEGMHIEVPAALLAEIMALAPQDHTSPVANLSDK
jgi:hypothetical protein